MANGDLPEFDGETRIRRPSSGRLPIEPTRRREIADRVCQFYTDDIDDRAVETEARLQRYAKFRAWTEGKDWPWPNASDIALTDMMQHAMRVQDTLHNAVMSARPPVTAKAMNRADKGKERSVDVLVDHQVFVEQGPSGEGEKAIGELIEQFVNDGVFTAFIPWVKESRELVDTRIFPPIPEGMPPLTYFGQLVPRIFEGAASTVPTGEQGWNWRVRRTEDSAAIAVKFFTRDDDRVEMSFVEDVTVFDGPKLIPKPWSEVLTPPRVGNLQIPGPSNPRGSPHVILIDRPTLDELKRLGRSGVYEYFGEKEIAELNLSTPDRSRNDEKERQLDDMQGRAGNESPTDAKEDDDQQRFTRLMCFDTHDIDGDGVAEDVVYIVILEIDWLVRARRLTELYPSNPPRRPFAEAPFLPIEGRREGISLLEMIEGIHDAMKTSLDQMIDYQTITNAPIFFYRSQAATRNEVIRFDPGEGYPLANPKTDVEFPTWPSKQGADTLNLLTVLNSMEERTTMQSDLSFGRVPRGGSSALRTVGGMALVFGQGEARPERIIRRFFLGLTEIWHQFHELNQSFLPKEKQIALRGPKSDDEDPYLDITDIQMITGRMRFDFSVNAFNSSRAALQQSLQTIGGTYFNALSFQLGTADAAGFYRWQRDFGDALGIDPAQYLKVPVPGADLPLILAEEAIHQILQGGRPSGRPGEPGGAQQHMRRLLAFQQQDEFGLLGPDQLQLFGEWLQQVAQFVQAEQQQAQLAAAADQFGRQEGGGQPGRPGGPPQGPAGEPAVQGGELLDESLPTAGGGANTGEQ
jgi:hypothetical protein|tara:strand:+ start:3154 stop:5565 length:2412 start_codon:yes stop_codon:yes gene_type:complete